MWKLVFENALKFKNYLVKVMVMGFSVGLGIWEAMKCMAVWLPRVVYGGMAGDWI